MREQILNLRKQFKVGEAVAENFKIPLNGLKPTLEEVVIAGIGGSAIPGQILKTAYQWVQLRAYSNTVYHNAKVVIAISWSGNTAETIDSYKLALNNGLETIAITSGGKLAELAQDKEQKLILLPSDIKQPPRLAVGYMTAALFRILPVGDTLDFQLDASESENLAQVLAKQIGNKTPLIYAPYGWRYLAGFWKVLFNENAKIHGFSNAFPLLEHNELAGFNPKDKDKYFVIVIKDPNPDNIADTLNDPLANRDIDLTIALLDKIGYNSSIVNLSGKTFLEKVMNNYTLALWTSYYLAKSLAIDPEKIDIIEELKRLKK